MMADSTTTGEIASRQPQKAGNNEEPDLRLEPDLPSDGPDEEGETMIRNLPERPELSRAPSGPDVGMATNPNVPPPEPVTPLSTPPEPGEVQTTPMPMG